MRRCRLALVLSTVVVGTPQAVSTVGGTWATYADTATVTGPGFAAATVAPPTDVRCVDNGSQDHVAWTPPGGAAPTAYRIHVNGSTTVTATLGAGVTQWRPATTLLPQTYSNVRVVAVRGTWTSVPSTTTDSISTLFLFQGTSC
jgi:hypothetical protein